MRQVFRIVLALNDNIMTQGTWSVGTIVLKALFVWSFDWCSYQVSRTRLLVDNRVPTSHPNIILIHDRNITTAIWPRYVQKSQPTSLGHMIIWIVILFCFKSNKGALKAKFIFRFE